MSAADQRDGRAPALRPGQRSGHQRREQHHVLLLAFVCSSADDLPLLPPTTVAGALVAPTSLTDLVRCWPYLAARVVCVQTRPV